MIASVRIVSPLPPLDCVFDGMLDIRKRLAIS